MFYVAMWLAKVSTISVQQLEIVYNIEPFNWKILKKLENLQFEKTKRDC